MTSTAMFDNDQDFSFPTVSDSSGDAANLFSMSSPSLWHISSMVPEDFFGIEHGSTIPSCSPQEPNNFEEENAGRPSTKRGGDDDDDDEDVHEYRCHDRSETMDLLWEEFNFSDELLDHRVPSNITAAGGSMRGLDGLHVRSRSRLSVDSYAAKDHRTSFNFNARKSETMERYDELRLHLEPLDVSKKTSTSSDSGYSVSVSPKRQKRRAMMPKMVWKLLTLHKLACHKRS